MISNEGPPGSGPPNNMAGAHSSGLGGRTRPKEPHELLTGARSELGYGVAPTAAARQVAEALADPDRLERNAHATDVIAGAAKRAGFDADRSVMEVEHGRVVAVKELDTEGSARRVLRGAKLDRLWRSQLAIVARERTIRDAPQPQPQMPAPRPRERRSRPPRRGPPKGDPDEPADLDRRRRTAAECDFALVGDLVAAELAQLRNGAL